MLGLTNLGIVHTAISLVAVATGFWTLARYREITTLNALGRIYLVSTALTALTGLGIFQHGGFGVPHVLSIMTLAALGVGFAAGTDRIFGRRARVVQAIAYTTTVFFHMIPGFAETLTRVPPGQPVFASQEAPGLTAIHLALAVLYVIGLAVQLRWLRRVERE